MNILDQFGRPIKSAEVGEPQTARVAYLHHEFAQHPGRGLTPARLAALLEAAERGQLQAQADLGDDMEERDAHLHAELGKRRRAVLSVEQQIQPPLNATPAEKRAADFVAEIFDGLDIDELILSLGDAILKGYAAVEIDWGKVGNTRTPAFTLQPQRWFQLPPNNPYSNDLRLRDGTAEGEELIPGGWLVHIHRARPGYLARSALVRVLSWPYLFRIYSARDFAEFLEVYGLPIITGRYPPGASDREKLTLLKAVTSIGHAARGILPQGMDVEINDAASAGAAGDPFLRMMDWAERSESKAILGQTLSAEAKATGMGSGVADLQAEVRDDILRSDARQLGHTISYLCYLVAVFSGHTLDPGRGPRFLLLVNEKEDIGVYSKALPLLAGTGMRIPIGWAHERLRIPEATPGEPILTALQPAQKPQQQTAAALVSTGDPQTTRPALSAVDHIAAGMTAPADDALHGWIDHIRTLVDSAQSLDDLRDLILAAYSDLPADQLANVMQSGIAIAELAGRSDVAETHGGG
jgi:phage gp29-like protein